MRQVDKERQCDKKGWKREEKEVKRVRNKGRKERAVRKIKNEKENSGEF